jgi:hypothetical protein
MLVLKQRAGRESKGELPEPGMPEMAIKRRSDSGIVWNFAGLGGQLS